MNDRFASISGCFHIHSGKKSSKSRQGLKTFSKKFLRTEIFNAFHNLKQYILTKIFSEKVPKLETFINIANVLGVSTDLLLADVLNAKYEIKSSEITDEISSLKPTERDRIYNVIGAMIDFEKKK